MLFTTIATVGSGEHYVVDLIAAVPFLVALEAATAHRWIRAKRRIATVIIGLLLYAAWILIVRSAPMSIPFLSKYPAAVWALAAVSIAVSTIFAMRYQGLPSRSLAKTGPD